MEPTSATILIVDDSEQNLQILTRLLQKEGHRILEAINGYDALDILREEPVDLVLLDVMMPGMDGFTVLEQVRNSVDLQTLPVILISSLDSTEDIVTGMDLGANDYIVKPFSMRLVRRRVQTQLALKGLADQQKQALQAVTEANTLKTRLLQIASHDLKNPLSNLLMMIEMMQSNVPISGSYVEMIEESVLHMKNIVTEFLDSEIVRDGDLHIKPEPVKISHLTEESLTPYLQMAENKRVIIEIGTEDAMVYADPQRTKQILANLFSNAIKYTHPSTTVRIIGRQDDTTNAYQLDVLDEGDGIRDDEAHRLFQPFSRLSNKPTDGEDSTGLGLWIVKQMADAQGCEVGVNLDYTAGAQFYLRMPLSSQD